MVDASRRDIKKSCTMMHRHRAALLVGLALFMSAAAGPLSAAAGLDEAIELIDEGWVDDAESILDELVAGDPNNPELYYQLSRLHLFRYEGGSSDGGGNWDDLDRVEDYAERAIELDPDDARFYVIYGHGVGLKAMNGGKVKMFTRAKAAKRRYEKAAELDPENIESRTSLIEFHMQAPGVAGGDKDEARRLAGTVAKIDSAAGFDAWKTVYLYDENHDALESLIQVVIDAHPDSTRGYIELARLCERRQDFGCARENFEKVLALDTEDVQPYWYLQSIYAAEGRADKTVETLDLAIARQPGEAYVYRWKADFYRSREEWGEAVLWYARSLEVDTGYARSLYWMGVSYLESGKDLDLAGECFDGYLEARLNVWWPDPALAHCQLARLYAEQGDERAAKREVKAAKKLNPGNDEVRRTAKDLRIR